jgi:hypothetical protein
LAGSPTGLTDRAPENAPAQPQERETQNESLALDERGARALLNHPFPSARSRDHHVQAGALPPFLGYQAQGERPGGRRPDFERLIERLAAALELGHDRYAVEPVVPAEIGIDNEHDFGARSRVG